jgi:hypothetical protein
MAFAIECYLNLIVLVNDSFRNRSILKLGGNMFRLLKPIKNRANPLNL